MNIKEIAPKPSDALQAMIDGLLEQSKRPDFKIDMSTFGRSRFDQLGVPVGNICFGCAATCTIQKIAGKNFNEDVIKDRSNRAHFLNIDFGELLDFETAIDDARAGDLYRLFEFYDIPLSKLKLLPSYDFVLTTDNWQNHISDVESLILELRAIDY